MRLKIRAYQYMVCTLMLFTAATMDAQDLGHKLPGLIGLDAGRIPPPGLYLVDRVVSYEADELRDRNGNVIPLQGLELQAFANATALSYTTRLWRQNLFLTVTAAAPIARFSVSIPNRPEAAIDRFGLADIYIQPLQLGWRQDRFDLVGSYAVYLPTGAFSLTGGKGVSSGQLTHQFSAGGTIYSSQSRSLFLSALASYELNLRKHTIDITRGNVFQIQGGAGVSRLDQTLELGVAGFSFWQVGDDRGSDLPVVLRGARDSVFGLGPEAALRVDSIRSQLRVRYEWDMGVRSRPTGNLLVFGMTFLVRHP